jgi:hypothetical protein
MKFLIEIEAEASREDVANVARAALEACTLQNMQLFRRRKVPRLYEARVKYVPPEGDEEGVQRILSALEALRRGSGTCVDLCCWRAAELRVLGDARLGIQACKWDQNLRCHHGLFRNEAGKILPACPGVKIYWRSPDSPVLHCEVRLPNGSAEDPSRFLGMVGSRRTGG